VEAQKQYTAAQGAHAALAAEREQARSALESAKDRVHGAAKAVLVEEADGLAAELDAAAAAATVLRDQLLALADFSAMGRGETWAQGKLQLSAATLRRVTTPLDHRPQLPGGETYESRQAEAVRRLMAALQAGDADARL
jgi:hypothetical protein